MIGREGFINNLWRCLESQSVLLVSERRFGKTTVIKQMHRNPKTGWLVIWRDVEGIKTALEFAERVFRDISEHLSARKKAATNTLALLKLFGGAEVGGVIKLPAATQVPWKTLLEKAFDDLMEDKDSNVVFLWDEMPFMIQKIHDNEGPAAAMDVLDALRGIRQTHSRVRMVYCGSIGMHHVTAALKQAGHKNAALNDLLTVPLPALAPDDAIELCRSLIQGEGLDCTDLMPSCKALIEAVDHVPFYVHSVMKELSVQKKLVSKHTVQNAIEESIVAEHDPWHLRHFEERLASYYGTELEPLAGALLDALAVAQGPLSLEDLQQAIASTVWLAETPTRSAILAGDLAPLRKLLVNLAQDHYCEQVPGSGRYRFRFQLIKRWWVVHRGLA